MEHTTIADGATGLAIRTILNNELAELLGREKYHLIVVADTTARDALPAEYLTEGTLVYITADNELQEYDGVSAWAQPELQIKNIVTTAMSNLNGGITVTPPDDRAAGTFRRNSASQTAYILQVQAQDNSPLMHVDKDGKIATPSVATTEMSNMNGGVTVTPASDIIAGTFRRNSDAQTSLIVDVQTELNAHLAGIDKAGKVDGKTANFGDGTNYTETESNGFLHFAGTAGAYKDLIMPAANLKPGATTPTWAAFDSGIYGYRFDAGTSQSLHGAVEAQHDYREGSDIHFHLHWSPTTTNTGNIVWGVEYSIANAGDIFPATTTVLFDPTAAPGVINKHVLANGITITGTTFKIGAIMVFRVFRQNGGTDTFTGNAFLHSIGVHYICDSVGSRSISSK